MLEIPKIHVGLLIVELHIPDSHSLKSKRKTTKSIRERIRNKFNASVAELGYHDKWQRSLIGVTVLGNDRSYLESQISKILNLVESQLGSQLISSHQEFLT